MSCTKKHVGPAHATSETSSSRRGLAAAPDVRVHPLRVLFVQKGVSLVEGARLMGWSLRKLMLVIHEWRRPRDAENVARDLGRDPEDLFPRR